MCLVSSRAARDAGLVPTALESLRQRTGPARVSAWEKSMMAAVVLCVALILVPWEHAGIESARGFLDRLREARHKQEWDFQHGLAGWRPVSSSAEWFQRAGTVRPTGLRIWSASEKLTDYRVDFGGRITRGGVSWAVRALDAKNYYAWRIQLSGSGALHGELIRYSVIDGRESEHTRVPLTMPVRSDKTYTIRTDVRGSQLTTFIDGRLVDTWSDQRLARGGFGLFSEPGQASEIIWVKLAPQDHLIGRMLANARFIGLN